MGQPIGAAADLDEDELLNELEVRQPGLAASSGVAQGRRAGGPACPHVTLLTPPSPG